VDTREHFSRLPLVNVTTLKRREIMAEKDVKDTDAQILEALDEGEQDTTESSPEDKKPEAKEAEDTKEPDSKETEKEPESKVEPEEESKDKEAKADEPAEETESKPTKADERKTQLNTEIRDLVAKRNALKVEVEKANAEVYQPATEDELTGQPKDPNDPNSEVYTALEARVEAMDQQRKIEKYNSEVAEAQLTISHESEKVLSDFSWANPDSADYEEEIAAEAAQLLESNLIIDPHTQQVIGSNVSPYQLYKTIDRAHKSSTIKGQIKGREDTEAMLANADTPSGAAPIKKTKNPIDEILESDDY
jgi:hypothetical protein